MSGPCSALREPAPRHGEVVSAGEQTKDERFYRQEEARHRSERRVSRALSPELTFSSESKREMTGVEELLSAVAMWGGPQGFKVRGQEGRVVWP